jgi:hypothetical protein
VRTYAPSGDQWGVSPLTTNSLSCEPIVTIAVADMCATASRVPSGDQAGVPGSIPCRSTRRGADPPASIV